MKGALLPLAFVFALLNMSCHRTAHPPVSGLLSQRGYLWQRVWTSASSAAVQEAAPHLAGLVLLAAELPDRNSNLPVMRPRMDWSTLAKCGVPISLALRIAPTAAATVPQSKDEAALHAMARSVLEEARTAGVKPAELQVDFDAPQKQLGAYRAWLHRFRAALPGERVVITALPAWLEEPEFATLVAEADSYVLQVHSVPARAANGRAVLCDSSLARRWVARAAHVGRPFAVALPTYSCVAGFGPDGRLLGVAMDGLQPAWPAGTRTWEMGAEADELAGLVHEWEQSRPPELREVIWYRVPVPTDLRNWTWPTLAAVMAGRAPVHRLEAFTAGDQPLDIVLQNAGEAVETSGAVVRVRPLDATAEPVGMDALGGWNVRKQGAEVLFGPSDGFRGRLLPGDKRRIGWVRYEKSVPVTVEVTPPDQR